ncbi:MAG: DUF971 domain-containing protein [Thermoanaerobaculum sp.]
MEKDARLRDALVVGSEVVLLWEDGHESYFPGELLRKACTCASCKGETHLFGKKTLPTLRRLPPEAFVPVAVRRVGNYGLQVVWGDGHDFGIYHLEDLRRMCPCPSCTAEHGGSNAPLA